MKPRHDSALAQLTEEQQAQVYDWLQTLGYTESIKKIAEPAPDGFGLKTYRASLHRFYVRYTAELKNEHGQDAVELTGNPEPGPALVTATQDATRHIAFQIATSPHNTETFKHLSEWLTKQEYLALAREQLQVSRERLALEREKAELNAARLALKYQMALQEIIQDQSSDDEDKIRAARDLIFGPSASPTVGDEVTSLSSAPSKIQN